MFKPSPSIALLLGLALAAACGQPQAPDAARTEKAADARDALDGKFAIATANPLATQAGADVLARGGTAADAAIAVQAVLSLVEPQSSGLGGGAFMLHYDPSSGRTIAYDGRETAPQSAAPDMFLAPDGSPMNFYDAITGGRSVGVPGVIAMLTLAHQQHGTLPLAELLAPARELAENGFDISPRLNGLIVRMSEAGRLGQMTGSQDYFFDEAGAPLPVGHVLKNPAYARMLQTLSDQGPGAFYGGEIAQEIAATVDSIAGPGTLTVEDFFDYSPVEREPVCAPYRGKTICSMGPPSSGGVTVLQILSLLEQTAFDQYTAQSPEAWHLLMEASRLAYADRNLYLADPAFMSIGDHGAGDIVDALLAPGYIADRASLIQVDRSAIEVAPGDPFEGDAHLGLDGSPEPPSTSHFSIRDGKGRVVSMTSSVEAPFGSHIMAAGIILNNQLTDFSFVPERNGQPVANAPLAGKRPRSSMSPVIIFNADGSFHAALGSPGGPAIIGYVAKTIVGMLDWDMTMQEAIDLPNIVIPRGGVLVEDDRLDAERLAALAAFGLEPRETELSSGVYGVMVTADGELTGGADKRREGTVVIGDVATADPE
ncbi:gamma-glutamyltransferase [Aquisalinus flavus]|uniref:Glutathione hydrolase proenzyme n=1 Tax=Aquisalinus flavus TaxID=1526572 RepID=A0A8J2V278_9PROT|nr:gamma-glutamyltransferase [Aquisalinus flavus]MBD0426445.1 gamma-glutamyltransferase [Aquisalinus flavus]UNE48001.1 gamma-glutamyltransferase [Aquisalinus flavus]GGD07858.1 gamma-glutamyltranspeptidase [Aquisalinus flavus]